MIAIDDKYVIAAIVYIGLLVILAALIPSDIYTGSSGSAQDGAELSEQYNATFADAADHAGQLNFIQKAATFLFIPFTIDGMPVTVGLLLGLLNYLVIFVAGVWIYDKLRGIGS